MKWVSVKKELPTLRPVHKLNTLVYESALYLVHNGTVHIAILQKQIHKEAGKPVWRDAWSRAVLRDVKWWAPIAPPPAEEQEE